MFAPWRPQKSLRRHKDPITGNFLNASVVLISYLNLVERSDFLFSLKSETSINDVRFGKCFSRLFKYLTGNGTFVDNRYKAFVMATIVIILNFPSVYEFVTLYKKTPCVTEFMPDISMTAT